MFPPGMLPNQPSLTGDPVLDQTDGDADTEGAGDLDPNIIPLPPEGRGSLQFWKEEIKASDERVARFRPEWNRNLKSYRSTPLTAAPISDTIVVPRDFSFVEQKKSQLFFQVPEVHLKAEQPGLEDSVMIFQAVVNHYLGEDGVNALAMMNEVTFDALCPSGLMCSKIGFESFSKGEKPIQIGEQPDPNYQPPDPMGGAPDANLGSILGLGTPAPSAPMVPKMESVPNIVRARYYWERLSPACIIVPDTFTGSMYDKAPFLGYKFEDDWDVIKKKYQLPDSMEKPSTSKSEDPIKLEGEPEGSLRTKKDRVVCAELWYRCAWFDPNEADPEVFYQLVLCMGADQPLIHRRSKFQTINPQGELMGMYGNPIHISGLRYVSDSAFPPSECSISRATNDELNKSRTQMMLQRDRSIPMRFVDLSRIGGTPGLEKLRQNIMQGIIPLDNYDPANPPIGTVGLAAFPRENFTFNDYLDRDLGEIWAMGANQRGQETNSRLSATEISKMDQWAGTRLDAERRISLNYFIRGVRKLASLIQLFATDQEYVEILGPDKAPRLQPWDKSLVQGKYAFSAHPDSAIRVDEAEARTQSLKLYELLAKDPNVQRVELLYEICRHWNLDPQKVVIPVIPEKGPDPANVSFRFNAADLDIRNPNFPIYLSILVQAGYKIGPEVIDQAMEYSKFQASVMMSASSGAPADPNAAPTGAGMIAAMGTQPGQPQPHGGPAPKAERLNKHMGDQTGEPVGAPVK